MSGAARKQSTGIESSAASAEKRNRGIVAARSVTGLLQEIRGKISQNKVRGNIASGIMAVADRFSWRKAPFDSGGVANQSQTNAKGETSIAIGKATFSPALSKVKAAIAAHGESLKVGFRTFKKGSLVNNFDKEFFKKASTKVISYFSKRSVGIDISDRSIEIVEIKKDVDKIDINCNRILLEPGIVEKGNIEDREKLKAKVLEAMAAAKPHGISPGDILFALPERQVYTHVFSATFNDQEELKKKVAIEVESTIPLLFEDTIFAYKVIMDRSKSRSDKKESEIVTVAVSKSWVRHWRDFFASIGLKVHFFELEPCANISGLILADPDAPACIVDMGANTTAISVISKDGLFYAYSLPFGGDILTQKIVDESALSNKVITLQQADSFKRTQGFEVENEYTKVFKNAVQPVIDEISAAVKIGEERSGKTVKELVLIGGGASMKGLLAYFSSQFKDVLNISLGQIRNTSGHELPFEYVGAMGLAWRGVEKNQLSKIVIPVEDDKHEKGIASTSARKFAVKSAARELDRNKAKEADPVLKAKRQMRILLILLVLGAISIGGSFWMKAQRMKARSAASSPLIQGGFDFQRDVEVEVIVDLNPSVANAITGSLLEDIAVQSMSYNDTLKQSYARSKEKVAPGYFLWPEPAMIHSPKDKLIFPLRIDWFAYPEKQVEGKAIERTNEIMAGQKYLFNSSAVDSVSYDETNERVSLKMKVSIMASSPE